MSNEPDIFIAPCSREHKTQTFEHFENTVVEGVETNTHPELKQAGFDGTIGVWGVVSGNRTHWEKLDPGDVVLFYTKSGVYTHLAEVVGTEHNEFVGEKLWTTYDGKRLVRDLEEPWPFLIYLSNVQRVELPAEDLHDALGYSMEYPQGFMRPTDDRQRGLVDEFGSVERFLGRYASRSLSGSTRSIEETIAELNSWVTEQPVLTVQRDYTDTQRIIRSSAFRRRVRELYDSSCAVCGAGRRSPQGTPEIEAAHIYPKGRNGSDDVRNGLSLCKLHHWAFDVGWFSVADDHDLIVREARSQQGYEEFSRLDGQRLRLPDEEQYQPHPTFLQGHRAIHDFDT